MKIASLLLAALAGVCSMAFGLVASLQAAEPVAISPAIAANNVPKLNAPLLFSRHIEGVFVRLGCSGGTCHGAVQGRNGFRLSLFGAKPENDYEHLTKTDAARRVDRFDPANSLLLLKATAAVPHGGGQRTKIGSEPYKLLLRWIEAGMPGDDAGASEVKHLTVTPAQKTGKIGEAYPLKIEAQFADGSSEDVTQFCHYETLNDQVATISEDGQVKVTGVGDTALIVRYKSVPGMATVLAPREMNGSFPETKPANFIDEQIIAKLKKLNIPQVGLCDDATFLRRATIDLTGELPTPEDVRKFLADASADKRAKKIDELLARPGHAALWTMKFCDLLKARDWGGFGQPVSMEREAPRFQAWIRARLDENAPYDKIVERILTATTREGKSLEEMAKDLVALEAGYTKGQPDLELYKNRQTPDLYWQRNNSHGVDATLQISHAFLGLRLECAKCHRHPADVWQQDDLLSFANFFMSVRPFGNESGNEKRYPELDAFRKAMEPKAKEFSKNVAKRKEAELKPAQSVADKAKKEIESLTREATKNEQAAGHNTREKEKKKKPEDLAELDAKIAKHTKEAADLRAKIGPLKETIKKYEDLKAEIEQLERQGKAMESVGSRIVGADVHIREKDVKPASVTSPLGTQSSSEFRFLGSHELITVAAGQDPRPLVMEWMRRPDNPFFARAIVNRVWAHYFGRGIVNPPDNLSPFNPASHPELLQQLADGFIKHKYDLRWLHRTIVTSRTYQLSSVSDDTSNAAKHNFAYFTYRRMPAEVLYDALEQATGSREEMQYMNEKHHWPKTIKAVEMPFPPDSMFVRFMLESFGAPTRNPGVVCDCERDSSPTMLQVLSLISHPRLRAKIADKNGTIARITKELTDDAARLDELFLTALGRLPTEDQKKMCLEHIKASVSPEVGLQGVMWSLLNSQEFMLQH